MKKVFVTALGVCTMLSLVTIPTPVQATDFSGQEDKYMKLCSSSNLSTNNLNTCKEFNTYLKNKNKELKSQVSDSKSKVSDTQNSLNSISSEISALNDQIAEKQKEIEYLQTSISNLEASIAKKEEEVKERMYSMQSYNNNNSYIDFIFGASSFTDMFARIDSVNEITSYDDELVAQLADEKEQVETQKATVVTAKANIESQKSSKQALQQEYQALFEKQNADLIAQEKAAAQAADSSQKITDNIAALLAATEKSQVSGGSVVSGDSAVGNAIAQKALTRVGYMYVWGGCHSMSEIANPNHTAFDCSGLVNWAYYQSGVNIGSNNTKSLASKGVSVSRNNMQAGDIILFSSNGSTSGIHHVGIYIGNNQFVHASTSSGVIISSMNEPYWKKRYNEARRVLSRS